MNKKHSKVIFFCIFILLTVFSQITAFEWPQEEVFSNSFFSYFSQLRGGSISSSLIFSDPADVKATEDGKLLAVIREHPNEDNWFESPLGNAVIIIHKDNLLTVYGNLDHVEPTISNSIKEGSIIGHTGNSGWQQGKSCLELQVLDTKNNTAINPRVLMPRIGQEETVSTYDLSVMNAQGKRYYMSKTRYLKAGEYYIYQQRDKTVVPYKTTISLNGVSVETISHDVLIQDGNNICVKGKQKYSVKQVYPDDNSLLLGKVMLPHGKNIISITLFNILGKSTTRSYSLTVN